MSKAKIVNSILLSVGLIGGHAGSISQPAFCQTGRHAVIVSSASGGGEFRTKFWDWSSEMFRILHRDLAFPRANIAFLFEDPQQDSSIVTAKSTKRELLKVLDALRASVREGDLLFFFLVGHGSFDGSEYKFNLVGPDITGSELSDHLDRFDRHDIVFVCSTQNSGVLTKTLSKRNRVVITATKNEFENNDTVFAEFFVKAFTDKSADTDKNSRVTILEAYLYAANKVEAWYKEQKRLATEHSLLEDNGDRVASRLPSPASGEGLLASKLTLAPSSDIVTGVAGAPVSNAELRELYSARQKLEAAIEELRYKKGSLPETEYNKKLESYLIELAQTSQQIKKLEGTSGPQTVE